MGAHVHGSRFLEMQCENDGFACLNRVPIWYLLEQNVLGLQHSPARESLAAQTASGNW